MELFDTPYIDSPIVRLYMPGDQHHGCQYWAKTQFDADMEAIMNDPYGLVVIPGDTMQKDLRTSVGNVYAQTIPPGRQKYVAADRLYPIAKKIIGISGGNHDEGSRIKEDSTDVEDLCKFLGVHYFEDELSFSISHGRDKYGNPKVWTFYGIHGCTNSATIGGVANGLRRLNQICDADVYFMGHTHQCLQFSDVYFRRDISHRRMVPAVRYYVCSASYQGKDRFPIINAMPGKTVGCPVLTLDSLRNRISIDLPTGICA